jgi:hypothetical protein
MNIKLNKFFALAAIAIALIPQAEAQNTNHTPGNVISWGDQVIPNVAPGTRFTKIAAGGAHNLALKSDGTVVAWGLNDSGQSTVPGGLNGVVAIAAGAGYSLALIAAAPQPFTLGAPQRMPDGSFRCMLFGEAGRNYTVQSSTNLTLWTDLQTLIPDGSSVSITDTNASAFPRRF